MRRRFPPFLLALHLALLLLAAGAPAGAVVPTDFADEPVAGGFSSPVGLVFLPDGRALVAELSTAQIRMIRNGVVTTLATVPNVRIGSERGLLGIAVDPDWPARPYVYVHSTSSLAFEIHISRFTVSGDLENTGTGELAIAASSRYDVLTGLPDDIGIHNGGTVRFGPDRMLYVSLGDDAEACQAQELWALQGKILRLEVSGLPADSGGPPPRSAITPADNPFVNGPSEAERLVWVAGVRNPFRFSVDPQSGRLYVADVGQNEWEEMSEVTAGGWNLGWPWYEGFEPFATCVDSVGPAVPPIHVYDHNRAGQEVIIAGPLYRRPAGASNPFPAAYDGSLFYSEFYKGELVRLTSDGSSWSVAPPVPGQPTPAWWGTGYAFVSDYQIHPDGSVWYTKQSTGEVRRIVSTLPPVSVDPQPRERTVRPGIYDLQGRRVERPEKSGVYFTRGRRIVVLTTPD